jgi:carboxyl-terminal processing protease
MVVKRDDVEMSFDLGDPEPKRIESPITVSMIQNKVGVIRFNNSLGNDETVSAFNDALENLSGTQGLVIDLRDTPGGGNTGVAEPILGRLVDTRKAYQVTVDPIEGTITRSISPTGPWTYEQPIVALVGRWTGSMGEGMAIGLDGMRRADVIGDCMAALAGGINDITLQQTGISIRVPAYDLTHVDGTPRHLWCVETPVTADAGNQEDELLAAAIAKLGVPTGE